MKPIIRFYGTVLLTFVGIVILVGLFGWWKGWNTIGHFATVFFWLGVFGILIGFLIGPGPGLVEHPEPRSSSITQTGSDFRSVIASTVSDSSAHDQRQQRIRDSVKGINAFFFLLLVGALLIGLALLMYNIF